MTTNVEPSAAQGSNVMNSNVKTYTDNYELGDEQNRKSISAAPSFEEYMNQRSQ
eukprot:CAMPEP_0119010162 /NCGR_PEP_ID=MMETSP1176-20130426/4834_1 /TAXON_ID=265551 /ORGANISM="Synedropsis recta cf, Strain CCMP1620" /LENGTH=53 /DNA_ID=CAMNT_0006962781 /DNA_START=317 /DNA_END=478 /DNA_ORIENTATION=+